MTTKTLTPIQARAYGALMAHPGEQSGAWSAWRKQLLLRAIDTGAMTAEEARMRYSVSPAELEEWRRGVLTRRDIQPARIRRADQL